MARKRTIKPPGKDEKEGAAFAIWIRLTEHEISVLERVAKSQNMTLKELLRKIALNAIEKRARAENSS
jgi:hypothetical protein